MTEYEVNTLLTSSKEIMRFKSEKSMFYVYKLNSLLIVEGFQYYGREGGKRINMDEIIDILENKFGKKLRLTKRFEKQNLCDTHYVFVFSS